MLGIFTGGLLLVPAADQAIKLLLRRAPLRRPVSLGLLGELRVASATIWAMRAGLATSPSGVWALWFAATVPLIAICAVIPQGTWAAGLMSGASLSHALEVSRRGSVVDYVRLRYWPAFNLADVALVVGACGVLVATVAAVGAGAAPIALQLR